MYVCYNKRLIKSALAHLDVQWWADWPLARLVISLVGFNYQTIRLADWPMARLVISLIGFNYQTV